MGETLVKKKCLLLVFLCKILLCLNVQELGLSELRQGASSNSLRSILSTLTLLMFHLYITVILGESSDKFLPGTEVPLWQNKRQLCDSYFDFLMVKKKFFSFSSLRNR